MVDVVNQEFDAQMYIYSNIVRFSELDLAHFDSRAFRSPLNRLGLYISRGPFQSSSLPSPVARWE